MTSPAPTSAGFAPLADLLNLIYGGALRTVGAGAASGHELHGWQALIRSWADGLQGKLTALGPGAAPEPLLAAFVQSLTAGTGLPAAAAAVPSPSAATGVLGPLSLNLERTYGGLADAFGLAPLRELQQALTEMTTASIERRRAQAEYLDVVGAALGRGAEGVATRLDAMSQRGESVETLLELLRLWARATDTAVHEAMQSPAALRASAELIRASTRARRQEQRVVALVSEALNVPTRAEVDEAYREIQALKREVRRLRKGRADAASNAATRVSPREAASNEARAA